MKIQPSLPKPMQFRGIIKTQFSPEPGPGFCYGDTVIPAVEKRLAALLPPEIEPNVHFKVLHDYAADRRGRDSLNQDRYYFVVDKHEETFKKALEQAVEDVKKVMKIGGSEFHYDVTKVPNFPLPDPVSVAYNAFAFRVRSTPPTGHGPFQYPSSSSTAWHPVSFESNMA